MPQGSLLVAVPPVVVNVHYVVVVFKLFDKQSHKLAVVLAFKVHGRIGYLSLSADSTSYPAALRASEIS